MASIPYRETLFIDYLKNKGITGEKNRRIFYLQNGTKYTPDIYIPILNLYVEVVGTRQAHDYNIHKYQEMMRRLPCNFALMTSDGESLYPITTNAMNGNYTCSVTGCKRHKYGKPEILYCDSHTRQLAKWGTVESYAGEYKKTRVKCAVAECPRPRTLKDLCTSHYQYSRKHGGQTPTKPLKWGTGNKNDFR